MSLRLFTAGVAAVGAIGVTVVQAAPAAAAGPLTITGVNPPSDVSSVGPLPITGQVANADAASSIPIKVQVTLDGTALSSAYDASDLTGTCDVAGATNVPLVLTDTGVNTVTATCPTSFTVDPSSSQSFGFALGLAGPKTASGALAGNIAVVDSADGTTVEAGSALPTITVHPAPVLSVTAPDSAGAQPVDFTGTLTNANGVAGNVRLDVQIADGGGLAAVTPGMITLTCALTVNAGAPGAAAPVALSGTDVQHGLSGPCPGSSGFALAADDSDSFDFHLSFDPSVPTGALHVTFSLVALGNGTTALTPPLATTPVATVMVFPAPTVTTSPPTVLATGAAPKSYSGSIANPARGHDYSNVRLQLTLGGVTGLGSAQVYVSCDNGASSVPLGGSISGGSTISGQCTPASGTVLNSGGTVNPSFQLCVNAGAPTGTLSVATALLDGPAGSVIASETAHNVTVVAGKSGAADCHATAGRTLVWTGPSDGDWTTSGNWDQGVTPTAADTVVVPAGASITHVGGQVANLVVDGGSSAGTSAKLAIDGALEVLASADLNGFSVVSDNPAVSASPGLTVDGVLTTAAGTDIELGNDAALRLPHTGTAVLGSSTKIHRPAAPPGTGNPPAFEVAGLLQTAGGTATLDQVALHVAAGGTVDGHGASLSLTGPSTSSLADSAIVTDSSSGGGIVALGNQATLTVTGTVTVKPGVLLQLLAGSALTDAGSPATINGPATGSSTLDWEGGAISGHLTLGPTLTTLAQQATDQRLTTGSVLTNLGSIKLQANGGGGPGIEIEGALDNKGAITVRPGTTVFGTASNAPTITNEVGATLGLEAPAGGGQPNSTPAVVNGVSVHNRGVITLPIGEQLRVRTGTVTLEGGALTGGGTPTTPSSGSAQPAGTLAVGSGASVNLLGTVTMQQDAVLALDDVGVSGASAPMLAAGTGGKLVAPSNATISATSVPGVLHWCAGKIASSLKTDANIKVEVGVGAAGGTCLANSTATVNIGAGADAASRHVVEFDGPASVNNATVFAEPHTELDLNGTATFGGGSTFDRTGGTVDDEVLRVGPNGQLTMPSLQLPSLFTTTHPTVKVPFVVDGRMTADSPLAVNDTFTNNGTTYIAAATTMLGSLTNTNTLTIFTSTLNARGGYLQKLRASASPPTPVTQLNDAQAILSTSNGATPAVLSAVNLTNGGLVGGGTVTASKVTVGAGFVRPSPFNNGAATTMTIKAPLQLSSTSDAQFIVNSKSHDVLKVLGAATLTGRITGFTGTNYTPAYLTSVAGVMTFTSHTGNFTASSWGGTPAGLGWKPKPLTSATRVDLQLVDVAPPSLGIASISAFTEFAQQRITYAGVDNKTGVKSYDVRWRNGSPTHAFSGWRYPTTWQHTTATSETLGSLAAGWEYCFSVRSRDNAGNTTPWSVPLCTTRVVDDKALSAHGAWKRLGKQSGFYANTYSKTTSRGAYLVAGSGSYTRVAVIAYNCGTCGTIGIYSGSTLLKKLNLRSGKTGLIPWVSAVLSSRKSPITIKALTSGKTIVIDAVGRAR